MNALLLSAVRFVVVSRATQSPTVMPFYSLSLPYIPSILLSRHVTFKKGRDNRIDGTERQAGWRLSASGTSLTTNSPTVVPMRPDWSGNLFIRAVRVAAIYCLT